MDLNYIVKRSLRYIQEEGFKAFVKKAAEKYRISSSTGGMPSALSAPCVKSKAGTSGNNNYREAEMDLETLLTTILHNRYLPQPKKERIFIGDGDFMLEGVNALRSLVHYGGVQPSSHVLEIGSGIGRVALPLTQYLDASGSYVGIDIVNDGVAWCHENITQVYNNFRFLHFDIFNPYYNPTGRGKVSDVALPFEDERFDVVFLNSVFTHLDATDTCAYVKQIRRVLKDGGRLWCSFFLITPTSHKLIKSGNSTLNFCLSEEGPDYFLDKDRSTVAVAYDENFVLNLLKENGFTLAMPIQEGSWSGIGGPRGYQDLLILDKKRSQ
jgi:SAM-dependent methyltransferase